MMRTVLPPEAAARRAPGYPLAGGGLGSPLREGRRVLSVVANPLGGVRTYLLYNYRRLMDAGYAFTFLAPDGEAFEMFKSDVQAWPGVECIGVSLGRHSTLWSSIRGCLRTRRFSLVHSQGLRSGTETAFANLGIGVSHVMTLHDVLVPQNDVPGRLKWLKKRVIGRFTRGIDAIIPVSHDCAANHLSHFPKWRHGRCRVQVIMNGIEVERIVRAAGTVDRDGLRRELGLSREITLLGFFGRFMPQKGFLVLLQALRELVRLGHGERVCLVATKDPHGYRGEYIREVERDRVLSRIVRFIEPVPEIAALLPQIDVLVMPSLWEACGLLAMEAMCAGVPVVGSDCLGLREVLRDTPSMAPRAEDPLALATALCRSLESSWRESAASYAEAARARFGVQKPAEELLGLFERCAR